MVIHSPEPPVDRGLMRWCLALSSSEPARAAAAAWLAAYEAALSAGTPAAEAERRAAQACERALATGPPPPQRRPTTPSA
jgi:hypothetical protein